MGKIGGGWKEIPGGDGLDPYWISVSGTKWV